MDGTLPINTVSELIQVWVWFAMQKASEPHCQGIIDRPLPAGMAKRKKTVRDNQPPAQDAGSLGFRSPRTPRRKVQLAAGAGITTDAEPDAGTLIKTTPRVADFIKRC